MDVAGPPAIGLNKAPSGRLSPPGAQNCALRRSFGHVIERAGRALFRAHAPVLALPEDPCSDVLGVSKASGDKRQFFFPRLCILPGVFFLVPASAANTAAMLVLA